jgi:hypothetical protein
MRNMLPHGKSNNKVNIAAAKLCTSRHANKETAKNCTPTRAFLTYPREVCYFYFAFQLFIVRRWHKKRSSPDPHKPYPRLLLAGGYQPSAAPPHPPPSAATEQTLTFPFVSAYLLHLKGSKKGEGRPKLYRKFTEGKQGENWEWRGCFCFLKERGWNRIKEKSYQHSLCITRQKGQKWHLSTKLSTIVNKLSILIYKVINMQSTPPPSPWRKKLSHADNAEGAEINPRNRRNQREI